MQRMHDEQTQQTNEAKASFQNQAIDKKRKMKATTIANHTADAMQDESAKQAQIHQMLAKQSNEIAELKSTVLDVLKSVKRIERALAEKDLNNNKVNIAKKDLSCDHPMDLFSFDPKLAKTAAESEK